MNQKVYKMMDELRGNFTIEESAKYIYATAAMGQLLGREQFQYLIDRYAMLPEFEDKVMSSVGEDGEKRDILKFLFTLIPQRVDNTLRMRMFYLDLTDEDIQEVIAIGLPNEVGIREYGSSESVEDLVIALFKNVTGTSFVDYCSGQGNMLARVHKEDLATELYGQEINQTSYYVSKIKLISAGAEHFHIALGDVLSEPMFLDENDEFKKVDMAFSQYPLGLHVRNLAVHSALKNLYESNDNVRISSKADCNFIDLLIVSIKETGKAVAVIPSGLLSNTIEQSYRKALLERGMIEGIISLPKNLSAQSSIDRSLLILSHHNNAVRMVDATEIYTKGRRKNELSSGDIKKIVSLYEGKDDTDVAQTVLYQDIIKNQYNLEPYNYLLSNQVEIRFPETLDKITEKMFRGVQLKASDLDEMITEKSDYQLVSLKDIESGQISKELSNVKIEDDKKYARYYLEAGDLLITAKGTVIKTAVANPEDNQRLIATGNLMVVRLRKQLINPVYLKVFLDSEIGRKVLKTVQTGTALISISTGALKDLTVSLPPMDVQNKIADEYNNRQQKIEEIKKQLSDLENEISGLYDMVIKTIKKNI